MLAGSSVAYGTECGPRKLAASHCQRMQTKLPVRFEPPKHRDVVREGQQPIEVPSGIAHLAGGKSRVLLDVPLSAVTARRLRSGVMNRVELVRTDSAEHLVTFAFGARARAARRLEAALSTAH